MEVKLLDRVREAIRMRHYSRRTEEAYTYWIRRYIVFHDKKHPSVLDADSPSRCSQPRRSVTAVLKGLHGSLWIIGMLLYGSGLRLQECLEVRVKDLDFDRHQLLVRRGKGQKDRRTMLPDRVEASLRAHLLDVKRRHERDLADGVGRVVLPFALDRKYPNASSDWAWQDPKCGLSDRNCRDEVLISVVEGAHIYASCVSVGAERIMHISVTNLARAEVGRLRDFSIGFCGPSVVGVSVQNGWVARVEGDQRHNVTWSLPDDLVGTLGIPSRARVSGFVVRLRPGWKRSRSDSAWWGESKIVAQVTTHDC